MRERELAEVSAFVSVVRAQGFAAASRADGTRKATLVERVAALEKRLGVGLLKRSTRSLLLTEEGRIFYSQVASALDLAQEAELTMGRLRAEPSGVLRVSCHPALAEEVMPGVVVPFLARYRSVRVVFDIETRRVDVRREPVDVALRVGPLELSDLKAKKVTMVHGGLFASRAYLKERGAPARPEELARHDLIGIPYSAGPLEWPFVEKSKPFTVRVQPRLSVTSFPHAIQAARSHVGIVRSPHRFVAEAVKCGELVPVLEQFIPPPGPAYAVHAEGAALVPKVRVFLERLEEHFATT